MRGIYEEVRDIANTDFIYAAKQKAFPTVRGLCRTMQECDPKEVLMHDSTLMRYDEVDVRRVLAALTPHNATIVLSAKRFEEEVTEEEKWYGTKYSLLPCPGETMTHWNELVSSASSAYNSLHLPYSNPFITTDFTLVTPKPAVEDTPVAPSHPTPTLLIDDVRGKCWYAPDPKFGTPKLRFSCRLLQPTCTITPTMHVMTILWIRLFNDTVNEMGYDAELAGLYYDLWMNQGLVFKVYGYSHKLPRFLEDLVKVMARMNVRKGRFDIIKEKYMRELKNFDVGQPYAHASTHRDMILGANPVRWSSGEKVTAMKEVTSEMMQDYCDTIFRDSHLECLVHGNATSETAVSMFDTVHTTIGYRSVAPSQHPENRHIRLVDGACVHTKPHPNPSEPNSAVCVYWQLGESHPLKQATLYMFADIIKHPVFDTLRTQQQLGYLVWSYQCDHKAYNTLGFQVIVQSSDYSVCDLGGRVDAFMKEFGATQLRAMGVEEFEQHRRALIAKVTERPNSLGNLHGRHWDEVVSGRYSFASRCELAHQLESITLPMLHEFFERYFVPASDAHHKLSTHVASQAHQSVPSPTPPHEGDGAVRVIPHTALNEFRMRHELLASAP